VLLVFVLAWQPLNNTTMSNYGRFPEDIRNSDEEVMKIKTELAI
jgi:hypothetical protein|tara:strand:+ start:283 stop:414 length:132 start_codon:yes stop_codon:yes gene_type:complete